MPISFARWVFAPSNARLSEDEERWWRECYITDPYENLVENRSQWCILVGEHQSGKSTLLAALIKSWQERALLIQDDYLINTNQEKIQGNILHRILHQGSWVLRHKISNEPSQFSHLSQTQKEFLRWAVEKFHGHRAFVRWLDGLPDDVVQTLLGIEFEDIYPSQTNEAEGQIEELVNLAHKLNYNQILIIVDTMPFPTDEQVHEIHQILGWLEPMQHHGLKMVMALPPSFTVREIRERSRSRVSIFEMATSLDRTQEIISRHLTIATEKKVKTIQQLCSPKLTEQIQKLVHDELNTSSPGAWLKITEILLEMATEGEKIPLQVDIFPHIKLLFFARFLPLRLGIDSAVTLGVWRGYTWISLDRAVYDFLAILVSHKNQRINHEIARTTKSNLHTLARRLRVAIEPDESETIYLKNIKGEGYWLENFVA